MAPITKGPKAGPAEEEGPIIPKEFLNSMGFIDYDHYGNVPWNEGQVEVKIPQEFKEVTRVLALDCEMVGISEEFEDKELARVSIVNQFGYCVFDSFAKPNVPVVSYETKWSGVTEKDLRNAPGVDEVRKKVQELVQGKILIGHGIFHDFKILHIEDYPFELTRDTGDFFKYRFRPGQASNPGLKQLCKSYLEVEIQNNRERGHSSIQDAQAALALYLMYADIWELEHSKTIEKIHQRESRGAFGAKMNISEINVKPEKKDLFVDSSSVSLRKNRVVGPYGSSQEYVDIQFRLLLEDFLRPLRDGVRIVHHKNRQRYSIDRLFRGVSVKVYGEEKKEKETERKKNFYGSVRIPIDSNHLRSVDWKKTKMFLPGSLVVLSADNFNTVIFGIVEHLDEKTGGPDSTLLHLRVKFSGGKGDRCYLKDVNNEGKFHMIESKAYFEAYKHTLEYLKVVNLDTFPLKKYIVDVQMKLEPPQSLLKKVKKEGKRLDFGALLPGGQPSSGVVVAKNMFKERHWPSPEVLGLDESQQLALRQALTQELSVIQGPPGCGKTFIGVQIVKLLLTNPWMLDNTPIMIVSYTNHSLDEILERVFKFYSEYFWNGDEKEASVGMIRLGGCSESEKIKPLTLVHKSRQHFLKCKLGEDLRKETKTLSSLKFLKVLFKNDPWLLNSGILDLSTIFTKEFNRRYLAKITKLCVDAKIGGYEKYGLEFWNSKSFKKHPEDNLGLKKVNCKVEKLKNNTKFWVPTDNTTNIRKNLATVLQELFGFIVSPEGDMMGALMNEEAWKGLSSDKDRKTRLVWLNYFGAIECLREYIHSLEDNILAIKTNLDSIGPTWTKEEHVKSARIIGMTTTGAVKNKGLILESFRPRVVLVEEAAHVLEAHIVCSLTKYCDQLILIGDHKQLRPLTADNLMAWRYQLDVSLMERLVRNGIAQQKQNWVQLKVQHRMRDEIARMVCPLIYKELDNHPDVGMYGNVSGCERNLFFIDHQFPESREQGAKSIHNLYEIEVVTALAQFFVSNGHYSPSRVSIIAMYKAQRDLIETRLQTSGNPDLGSVRVSTVDGYQGEENDIILLSLVRSNEDHMIGFLRKNNRLCVALSRAKHGLFMTGNMSCLAGAAENWGSILETLKDMNAIGNAAELPLLGKKWRILKKLKEPKRPPKPADVSKVLHLNSSTLLFNRHECDEDEDQMNSIVNQMKTLHLSTPTPVSPQIVKKQKKNYSKDLERSFSKMSLEPKSQTPVTPGTPAKSSRPKMRRPCGHYGKDRPCHVPVKASMDPNCPHTVPCCFKHLDSSSGCKRRVEVTCEGCQTFSRFTQCRKVAKTQFICVRCTTELERKYVLPKIPVVPKSFPVSSWVNSRMSSPAMGLPQAKINFVVEPVAHPRGKKLQKKCSKKFKCGHQCRLETDHPNHGFYRCMEICDRMCPRKVHKCKEGHPCWSNCKLTSSTYVCGKC